MKIHSNAKFLFCCHAELKDLRHRIEGFDRELAEQVHACKLVEQEKLKCERELRLAKEKIEVKEQQTSSLLDEKKSLSTETRKGTSGFEGFNSKRAATERRGNLSADGATTFCWRNVTSSSHDYGRICKDMNWSWLRNPRR